MSNIRSRETEIMTLSLNSYWHAIHLVSLVIVKTVEGSQDHVTQMCLYMTWRVRLGMTVHAGKRHKAGRAGVLD